MALAGPIDRTEVQRGSVIVYADQGLPDAENLKIKSGLVIAISVRPAKAAVKQLMLFGA